MWLHIRGVGEWTNSLYSYFEREQERLHNGEVMPFIPSSASRSNTLESKNLLTNTTPQKDFLLRNLARLNHAPMAKAASLDNPRKIEELHGCLNGTDSPAILRSESEVEKSDNNPFFGNKSEGGNSAPLRPPRSSQGSSKLTLAPESMPKTPVGAGPPKLNRQVSESTSPMKKIQATLQRTFSRKGSTPQAGYSNDGFLNDDGNELGYLVGYFSE